MAAYDEKTALIVVDVQNDFADPGGALYVKEGEQVVALINTELQAARDADALVVFTQDWHPESTPHFEKDGGVWPVHCVGDTWGAQLHPQLDAKPEEPRVRKGVGGEDGYSGFTVADPVTGETAATGLEQMLRDRGIERVVVVGLATDYCVKATAIDASMKGFSTTVLADAVRAVDLQQGDGAKAGEEMRAAGVAFESS